MEFEVFSSFASIFRAEQRRKRGLCVDACGATKRSKEKREERDLAPPIIVLIQSHLIITCPALAGVVGIFAQRIGATHATEA